MSWGSSTLLVDRNHHQHGEARAICGVVVHHCGRTLQLVVWFRKPDTLQLCVESGYSDAYFPLSSSEVPSFLDAVVFYLNRGAVQELSPVTLNEEGRVFERIFVWLDDSDRGFLFTIWQVHLCASWMAVKHPFILLEWAGFMLNWRDITWAHRVPLWWISRRGTKVEDKGVAAAVEMETIAGMSWSCQRWNVSSQLARKWVMIGRRRSQLGAIHRD